jgi:molybdopterin synthase sulfur carrier subunit
MTIQLRYFASLAERAGCKTESVEVQEGSDVAQLWRMLEQRHPALAGIGFRPLVACDQSYADWDRSLVGIREVAFLPPLSGG